MVRKNILFIDDFYLFECPHCNQMITVLKSETNCRIFRHGVYKHNLQQINPHLDKRNCDKLFEEGKIIGCGKPFKIFLENNMYAEECGYI